MDYREILERRRRRIERAEKVFEVLSDPELKKDMESDPELRTAILHFISGNGNTSQDQLGMPIVIPGTVPTVRVKPPEGSQLRAVLDAASQEIGDFTTKGLVRRMTDNGYHFEADDAQIAVNSALKQLQARGWVALVVQGRGRAASVFRFIKGVEQV